MTSQPPLVSLKNVNKHYVDGDVHAMRDVSLDVYPGDWISIVGASGCGKSTLLNMMGALDRPTSGEVFFRDTPLDASGDLDQHRAKHVGFVFQSYYLLPNLTASENVQIPMFGTTLHATERQQRSIELLQLVGLSNRIDHLPDQLSSGQRQRVAIARALANDPALVLADEPTGALDSDSGREVVELLERLNRENDYTLVMVTHDLELAKRGSRVVKMHDGVVQESLV
ncbi:ABC transporter ATP-binding protein [Stieleria varia]|uniref:Lipoprotein-releasing system ATP-binding protein LolD n=1 Tax=Stieleria varia TaxID=2528005 RepID=A0A5C6A3N0_9BACT|nr:ABC transporter ATP-binding protein [Stieleria varia]TWT94512.1 Lipoprotein-releasing system ATP-binding protein LolD [Stieleria varia]